MNTTEAVLKILPEKKSGLYGIWTHDFCDTCAVLYQLSSQANWELVIMLVRNKPVKWLLNDCTYMNIIYVNRGLRNLYNSNIRSNDWFVVHSLTIQGFITNQHNDQLSTGLLAQLVEHCTGITEVMGSNP